MATVPTPVALLARELRVMRRTRSGRRRVPWRQIADELARRGLGRFAPSSVAEAVLSLPAATHPDAPLADEAARAVESSFRRGWCEEFPGRSWPGLEEAQRQIRLRFMTAENHQIPQKEPRTQQVT